MKRLCVKYDKPLYLGFSILEISKTVTYEFHYDYIKDKYGDNATLAYTDTDSLIYSIKTFDYYEDIRADLDKRFDTSDFPQPVNRFNYPSLNTKQMGLFKDEVLDNYIVEFIAIRAICYCFLTVNDIEPVKKIKGIKNNVVKKAIKALKKRSRK